MTIEYYDIIGDVHGHAAKLIALLSKLGYREIDGSYQQPAHQVIFVGDFIDRGTEQKKVLQIVQNMVANGHARAVMGNHEFNAICYHTQVNGAYLRSHNHNHNHQHQAFLDEFPQGKSETEAMINWFKSLPVFLEFDGFRVIHACWQQELIEQLKPLLTADNCLQPEHYQQASTKDSFLYLAIETLLKGAELTLPEQHLFTDKDGSARHKVRVQWWKKNLYTYRDAAVASEESRYKLPDILIPAAVELPVYADDAPPVFFGHYWFSGVQQLAAQNAVCLDYSAARNGPLVAYRLNANKILPLHVANFTSAF